MARQVDRLPSGRWRARALVDGRRASALFATRGEAEAWIAAIQQRKAYEAAGLTAPSQAIRTTLVTILEKLAREQTALGRSAKTIRQTASSIVIASRCFGEEKAAPLTREDLVRFVAWARQNTKSQGRQTDAVLGIWLTAHRRAGLPVPPRPHFPIERKGRPRATPDELARFLEAMPIGTVERTLAEIVLRSGCRDTEARRLVMGDVDLEAMKLKIRRVKGWRSRAPLVETHPISKDLAEILKPYVAWRRKAAPTAPLLTLDGVHLLAESALVKRYRAACRRAGLPVRSGVAWLRNQAATLLGEAGVPVEVTRRWLGHTSVQTTERHYDTSRQWEARERLSEILDGILSRKTC